jgi:glutathione synthase/RimK-type ligase-like ATP-grasp enzyme
MTKLRIAGITRSRKYSPNHEINDRLIITKTADQLKLMNVEVSLYEEDSFDETAIKENIIFSMVRGFEGLTKLNRIVKLGRLIINHPVSVINCYRYNLIKYVKKHKIPFPKSILVQTKNNLNGYLKKFRRKDLWIKRGDVHSMQKEDVVYAGSDYESVVNILKAFNTRNILNAIIQEHINGDTVKFYAVTNTEFFHWYYIDGNPGNKFDIKRLKEIAGHAASLFNLHIYGGDAVILPDGKIIIIDLNDWPSFAPIRDEASYHIAKLIYEKGVLLSG